MALINLFLLQKKNTANVAKERLQIIISERHYSDTEEEPYYLEQMRKDILEVICKYVKINPEMLSVQIEQKSGDVSILELNIPFYKGKDSILKGKD